MTNVLVIGSGGREHALAWKLAQSEKVETVYMAPGNGGADGKKIVPVAIPIDDFDAQIKFVKENNVSLTVVGPDDALAGGIVDAFQKEGLVIFGPTQGAAQIESSKAFSKNLMKTNRIPTASFETFTEVDQALEYVKEQSFPLVVKASGLALGKGVYICTSLSEAEEAITEVMVSKKFGESGNEVVIEEFLDGTELSIHAFCDGKTAVLFPPSQDYKTIGEGNTGPNTGGMGTVAPLPWVDESLLRKAKEIVDTTLTGMKNTGNSFSGILYPGLMESNGEVKVLEFNARFGDPETQSYMRLLESDLYDVLEKSAKGEMDDVTVQWSDCYAACVVLASNGYPDSYEKGFEIEGIEEAETDASVVVFHAGTKREGDTVVTNGGRVLNVTATGDTLENALKKAYEAVDKIKFEGKYFRKDIGYKSL